MQHYIPSVLVLPRCSYVVSLHEWWAGTGHSTSALSPTLTIDRAQLNNQTSWKFYTFDIFCLRIQCTHLVQNLYVAQNLYTAISLVLFVAPFVPHPLAGGNKIPCGKKICFFFIDIVQVEGGGSLVNPKCSRHFFSY